MRAKRANSSTIRLSWPTSPTIVSAPCSIAGWLPLPNLRAMRSALSWIGVSGFLISCAMRRAASFHAASFCACTSCVESLESEHPARAAAEAGGGELEVMELAADDQRHLASARASAGQLLQRGGDRLEIAAQELGEVCGRRLPVLHDVAELQHLQRGAVDRQHVQLVGEGDDAGG